MTLLLTPRLSNKRINDRERLLLRMHTATNANQLSIIVLTRQLRRLNRPRQRTTSTLDLIRRNLLTIARTTKHNAQRTRIRNNSLRCGDAKRRVVIRGVVLVGATVRHLMTLRLKMGLNLILPLKTGVICSKVNTHKA